MEQVKTVKLENLKPTAYGVNYPMPDGFSVKAYNWNAAKEGVRRTIDVPEYVYNWMLYDTSTFQKGFLIVVDEDEDVKEEFKSVIPDDLKTFSIEEIKKLLNGDIKKLKKEVTEDTEKHIVEDFAKIAREIKLDSSAKKKYIATLLGHGEMVEFIFPDEE